jgi:general secretion pathway protein G
MRRAAALLLLLAACRDAEREHANLEALLKHDLVEMRKAIAAFRADKQHGPHSLDELKTAKYLRDIPKDPLTNAADWRVTTEAAVRNDDFTSTTTPTPEPEVIDVHSRAPGRDASGKLYSEY